MMSARELSITGAIAAGVTLVAAVAFYGLDIATGQSLFFTHDISGSDIWHLHYPMKHVLKHELHEGRIPLWCDWIGAGFPLHAEGQIAALYPPNLLLFSTLPLPLAFNWSALLHVVAGGAFSAMLARQLGCGRAASIVAAIVFGFCGFQVCHVKHINMIASAIWMPLLLLFLERAAQRARTSTFVGIALTVAMSFLAGHPQIAYQNLLIAALYSAVLLVRQWRVSPRHAARFAGTSILAVAIGTLLAAPQLLPTSELNDLGPRAEGLSIEEADEWQLAPVHLGTFVFPGAFGDPGVLDEEPVRDSAGRTIEVDGETLRRHAGGFDPRGTQSLHWEIVAYAGLIPLFLAALALANHRKHPRVGLLATMFLVSVALALGARGGLFYVFWHVVPAFDLFRFHARYLLYADLAIAILAALGLTLAHRGTGRRATVVAVIVCATVWLDLHLALGAYNSTVETPRWATPPPAVRAIRADADEPTRVMPTDPERRVFRNAYYRARGWHELTPYDPARNALDSNYNLLFEIESLSFYYQIYPRWLGHVVSRYYAPADDTPGFELVAGAERVAELYGVRHSIAPRGGPFEDQTVLASLTDDREIARFDGDRMDGWVDESGEPVEYELRVYADDDVLPRAWLVPSARAVPEPAAVDVPADAERALLAGASVERIAREHDVSRDRAGEWRDTVFGDVLPIFDPSFDPRREALIHGGAPPRGTPGEPIDADVEIERHSPQHLTLRVDAPRAAWMFLSETWYPGWEATVNGEPTKIWRANGAGRAVPIPEGEVEVEMRYEPSSFRIGLWLALLGLLLGLLMLVATPRVLRATRRTERNANADAENAAGADADAESAADAETDDDADAAAADADVADHP